MGLSLSYDIIKAHGGELKMEAKEGEGGRVYLPITTEVSLNKILFKIRIIQQIPVKPSTQRRIESRYKRKKENMQNLLLYYNSLYYNFKRVSQMKTFHLARGIGFLILLTIISDGYSQPSKLQFEHLTIQQGLSHNFVMKIMQDRKGYLWFGTGNGLNKYDGYGFKNYKFDPYDTTSLPKNQVLTLYEDRDGTIWVGTSESTCKFDPRSETFTRLEPSSSNPYAFKYAHSFKEDSEGNLWVGGSFAGELRQIDRKTGRFSSYNYATLLGSASDKSLKNAQRLHILFKDKSGTLWVGSSTGLHRLNLTSTGIGKPSKVSFTHYRIDTTEPNSLIHNTVIGIYQDHRGILWIVTTEGKLYNFNPGSGGFTQYKPNLTMPLTIFSVLETGITEDWVGNIWISSGNGIYRVDNERTTLTKFIHHPTDEGSISNNFIWSVLTDQSGTVWVATPEGVDKLDPHRKPFRLYHNDAYNPNSLSQNKVAALCEDKQGIVWVGTTGGGLNALDKKTGRFSYYRHNPNNASSLRSDTASAIIEDRHGNLWVGNGGNLSLLDRKTGKFTHYPLNHPFSSNPAASPIFTIYEDREGLLWLGTNNGLINFDTKTLKTIHYPFDPDHPERISDWWALSILEDQKGNLWIGPGSQALTKFNRKTGKFTQYKYDSHKPGSISSNTIPSIYEDAKGNLWFGTVDGGLCRFDYATETFISYTEKQGLAGNAVFSILEDNEGNLWLGTNNGLSKFSPVKQTFSNYDATNGLQSNLFTALYTEAAAFKGRYGTLYFGGNNGFNAFNPADIHPNRYVPPVVITQFQLFNKLIAGKQEAKEIKLDYDQNFFSFEFAALNYTNSQKNQYAYQLTGVDKDWVHSGTRRLASYTNIGPGEYTFRVKASNNDGIWNENGTFIRIIVNPPWWRTWWAYTFYSLCFLAGIFLIDRVQRQRLIAKERERSREKELVQAREIEKAYNELKRTQTQLIQSEKMASLGELTAGIAHEIQNPLNFVNNFSEVNTELIEELKGERSKAKGERNEELEEEILNDIKENEQKINHHGKRADAIVKGMLQHSRASTGKKELTDINALADEYLRLSYHGLRAKDKSFNADFKTNFDESIEKTEVIPQDIGRVLLNLFNNAFYAVTEKKKQLGDGYEPTVSVSTKKENDKVEIRVKDNGMGIPQKVVNKIFQPFFTTKPTGQGMGLGLSLSYDIIKAHGGELRVETKEGEGATFIIQLPIQIQQIP